MLATADKEGIVEGSIPGFAELCRVSTPEMQRILKKLKEPDEWSRDQDNEGRRIVDCDEPTRGGWRILGFEKFRDQRASTRRAYQRQKQAEYRRRRKEERLTSKEKRERDGTLAAQGEIRRREQE